MAPGIYDNCHTCWNACPTDAGDKCGRLSSSPPDAYGVGLSINTLVADIDIVIADGEISTGSKAQGDITVAGRIFRERSNAVSCVSVATGVAVESSSTIGDVVIAG